MSTLVSMTIVRHRESESVPSRHVTHQKISANNSSGRHSCSKHAACSSARATAIGLRCFLGRGTGNERCLLMSSRAATYFLVDLRVSPVCSSRVDSSSRARARWYAGLFLIESSHCDTIHERVRWNMMSVRKRYLVPAVTCTHPIQLAIQSSIQSNHQSN